MEHGDVVLVIPEHHGLSGGDAEMPLEGAEGAGILSSRAGTEVKTGI